MVLDEEKRSRIPDTCSSSELNFARGVGDDRPVWVGAYLPEGTPGDLANWTTAHYRFYLSFVRDHMTKKGKVLDIGCGCGSMAAMLGRYSESVLGIDNIPEIIEFAKKHNSHENVRFEKMRFPEEAPNEKFDYIFAVEVLEHNDRSRQQAFVDAAVSLLAPNGKLFLTMPVT